MYIHKKDQLIGLDIGSHSIKVVEIDHTKKGCVLQNFGIFVLPPDSIVEGVVKDKDAVSTAIKNIFKNLKLKKKNVAISISGYSVIIKKITLNYKSEKALEATIKEEAEQYIPFDINEVNLDFDILPQERKAEESGGPEEEKDNHPPLREGQMDVMLVAAKTDMVNEYVDLMDISGLKPEVLDVDAFALQNSLELTSINPEGCYTIVNVGAEELGINAIKNGVSLFSRDSSLGGSQITDAIMSEFNIGFEEAEKMKLGGSKIEKKNLKRLEEIFKSVVTDWVDEIKRAMDFLAATYPDSTIERILLSGGSCRIPGFQKYLELETETPVSIINPFEKLAINRKLFDIDYLEYMGPQAAVAVGLALRSVADK